MIAVESNQSETVFHSPFGAAYPPSPAPTPLESMMSYLHLKTVRSGRLSAVLLTSFLAPCALAQTHLTWSPLNEPGSGGRIDSVSVSPHNASRLLLGGDMLGIGVSTNAGNTWGGIHNGLLSYEINDFTWHPSQPNVVWAGTLSGPHVSTDSGLSWAPRRGGLPELAWGQYSAPMEKILFEPNSNGQVLLGFGGDHRQFSGNVANYGVVWASHDGGQNWAQRSTIVPGGNVMAVSHAGQTYWQIFAAVLDHGVYLSDDHGWNWSAVNNGLPVVNGNIPVTSLAAHPTNANVAWVTISDRGVYKTTNGGANWAAANSGLPTGDTWFSSIVVAGDGNTLYAGNANWGNSPGLFKSVNGGASWSHLLGSRSDVPGGIAHPEGIAVEWTELDPNNANHVLVSNSAYALRSTDGGAVWTDVTSTRVNSASNTFKGRGFSGLVARNIKWNPYNSSHLVLQGMDAATAMQSWDGGSSYRVTNPGLPNWGGGYDVSFAPNGRVFAVLGQGATNDLIGRSTDGGRNWTLLPSPVRPSEAYAVHVDPNNANRLWVNVGNGLWYTDRALGAADNWVQRTVGPSGNKVGGICPDPRDGDAFYLATDDGVYRTSDGNSFSRIGGPTSAGAALNLDPSSPDVLYATRFDSYWSDYGVSRYDKRTNAWERLWTSDRDTSSRIADLAVDPKNSNRLVVITDDQPFHDQLRASGVWVSDDRGQTWRQQNSGLGMLRGSTVAFKPDGTELVVGLGGRGFYIATVR